MACQEEEPNKTIELFIRTLTARTYRMEFGYDARIVEVKEAIRRSQYSETLPLECLVLLSGGKLLRDDDTLDILESPYLYLTLRSSNNTAQSDAPKEI